MSESPNATLLRSLLVKQPESAAALSDSQRRASANRHTIERNRREQARQHARVATLLRDLLRHA